MSMQRLPLFDINNDFEKVKIIEDIDPYVPKI